MKERTYNELLHVIDHCQEGSDEEFETYQEMVAICEEGIKVFRDYIDDDGSRGIMPIDLDQYAAPMDNLSRLYMKRGD